MKLAAGYKRRGSATCHNRLAQTDRISETGSIYDPILRFADKRLQRSPIHRTKTELIRNLVFTCGTKLHRYYHVLALGELYRISRPVWVSHFRMITVHNALIEIVWRLGSNPAPKQ